MAEIPKINLTPQLAGVIEEVQQLPPLTGRFNKLHPAHIKLYKLTGRVTISQELLPVTNNGETPIKTDGADPKLLGYVRQLQTKFQSLDRSEQIPPFENGNESPLEPSKPPTLELFPRTGIICVGKRFVEVGIPNIFVLNYLGISAGFPIPEDRVNQLARRFGSKSKNPGFDLDYMLFENGLPNIITRKHDGFEYVLQTKATILLRQNTGSILRVDTRNPEKAVEISAQKRAEFEEAARTYYKPIFRYLYRLCEGEKELAEDLTQVCFMRAFEHFEGFEGGEGKVGTWLYKIATHACLDEMRRRRVIRWCSTGEIPPATLDSFLFKYKQSRSPEDELIRDENHQSFYSARDKLPPKYRHALSLQMNGLSGEEIAEDIGTTPGAAKVLLFRARERLKSEITKIDPEIVNSHQ